MVVTFTALTGGTEIVLTERLGKLTLNTLQQILTAHLLNRVIEVLLIVLSTETWTKSILSTRKTIINGQFTNSYRNKLMEFNGRYITFMNRFNKRIMNRFI